MPAGIPPPASAPIIAGRLRTCIVAQSWRADNRYSRVFLRLVRGLSASPYPFLDVECQSSREIAEHDWWATALGPIERWPQVLKTTIALVLRSAFPEVLVWGPELVTFHNDAFRPLLGEKPSATGRPFNEVWTEIWDDMASSATHGGRDPTSPSHHRNFPRGSAALAHTIVITTPAPMTISASPPSSIGRSELSLVRA